MAKDKQQTHGVARAKTAFTIKMKRKEFEKELVKLQVELTRLKPGSKLQGHPSSWSSRAETRQARAV